MPNNNVEQGVAAIQAGNVDEGARLLKIALREPDVTGTMRAIACLWLAEISPDPMAKRTYYTDALDSDPGNAQIRQRFDAWMATQLMPPPPTSNPVQPSAPVPPPLPPELPGAGSLFQAQGAPIRSDTGGMIPFAPQQPSAVPRTGPVSPAIGGSVSSGASPIVAVIGGPNGAGTAFFVAREGLLATTRYIVGGADQLTIQLETGRQIPGYVVRAFPEIDLAFIYVEMSINDILPVTPLPRLPDNALLTVISHNGQIVQGRQRNTKRALAAHWFPTDISVLPDAGGCPILDEQRFLVGMITRNTASTSGYVYGLYMNTIRQVVETFRAETMEGNRLYCPHCGFYCQAPAAGGYYCEHCGGLTPQAERITRQPQPQTAHFYQEHSQIKCRHCNTNVGFYKGACLRCGRTANE